MHPLYVLHLSPYHLGDPLFLKSLAQAFHRAQTGARDCLLVHGSGEKLERTLESQGVFAEYENGILQVETDEQRRLAERAVREVNQDIVGTFTDEVVPTVGIQGVDRNLLTRTADGALQVGKVGWLEALLKQHVVAVVSSLAGDADTGTVREVRPLDAALALMDAFGKAFRPQPVVFTTTESPGLMQDGDPVAEADAEAVADIVPDVDAVRDYVAAGQTVLVTSPDGFFAQGDPRGTRVG